MTYGLQIFNPSGVLTFDSNVAVGGVCLGFYTVPSGGGSISFPDFVTEAGIVIAVGGFNVTGSTVDHVPGYLRFNFPALAAGGVFCLFAK